MSNIDEIPHNPLILRKTFIAKEAFSPLRFRSENLILFAWSTFLIIVIFSILLLALLSASRPEHPWQQQKWRPIRNNDIFCWCALIFLQCKRINLRKPGAIHFFPHSTNSGGLVRCSWSKESFMEWATSFSFRFWCSFPLYVRDWYGCERNSMDEYKVLILLFNLANKIGFIECVRILYWIDIVDGQYTFKIFYFCCCVLPIYPWHHWIDGSLAKIAPTRCIMYHTYLFSLSLLFFCARVAKYSQVVKVLIRTKAGSSHYSNKCFLFPSRRRM